MAQQNSKKKTKNQIQWKSSPYKRTKEEAAVFTVLLLSAFLYGGFYEFSGAMLAAVLGILLIVCRVKYSFQIKGKNSWQCCCLCFYGSVLPVFMQSIGQWILWA
ncbi:MAG: hypothetical protein ACLTTO_03280 [Lachnospiraceae bacterium]